MKWNNMGNENVIISKKIVKSFDNKKIYIFGAGQLGEELRSVLEHFDLFAGYIDNDEKKQILGYNGNRVLSILQYKEQMLEGKIVIAASDSNIKEIAKQLIKSDFRLNEDFYLYEHFTTRVLPILAFYCYDSLYVNLAQICITERCTLKCKKCAHACNNVSINANDMSFDDIKRSADVFFAKYDFVKEFVLIGGEPLLHKDLNKIIEYIGKRYRGNMIMFSITTNGTIVPKDETLKLCKKYDVTIRLSDYSETLPNLKQHYNKFYDKVRDNKLIVWKTDNKASWFDYGFTEFDRGSEPEKLIAAFDSCNTQCREIRKEKYYYCVMARSVAENMKIDIGKDDYIDLNEVEDRETLLEFQMGYSKKGYLDMCRYCRGNESVKYLIPAAEQEGT